MKKILVVSLLIMLSIVACGGGGSDEVDVTVEQTMPDEADPQNVGLDAPSPVPAFYPGYTKRRIIITTDIGGGDKDDTQSMVHFLIYSNMFDVEAIVISRPRGDISQMHRVINEYEKDYPQLEFVSPDYPKPEYLRSITKVGAERNQKSPAEGYGISTPGSQIIVDAARKDDPRPIYVLHWGSITDTAQALHDAPDIHNKLYIISGGSASKGVSGYNEKNDPTPYQYMRNIQDKKFIWAEGVYVGAGLYAEGIKSTNHYGNVGFVKEVIRPRGNLGSFFYNESKTININSYGIKMGDTGQLVHAFNGDFLHLNSESWGGRFCKISKHYYKECPGDIVPGGYNDYNKIVAKYRIAFLQDWEKRLIDIYDR